MTPEGLKESDRPRKTGFKMAESGRSKLITNLVVRVSRRLTCQSIRKKYSRDIRFKHVGEVTAGMRVSQAMEVKEPDGTPVSVVDLRYLMQGSPQHVPVRQMVQRPNT